LIMKKCPLNEGNRNNAGLYSYFYLLSALIHELSPGVGRSHSEEI